MAINRILTNIDRDNYKLTVDTMFKLCPEMMARKVSLANVQQAFVFDKVTDFYKDGDSILSVGCFEDTAYCSLLEYGYEVVGIDPEINYDLHTFSVIHPTKYNIIFSTSVIEHVKDDEQFINDICYMLDSGGYGILTMDFKDEYKVGDPLPYSDVRFYTRYDLETRLVSILNKNQCELLDKPDWSGKDNFTYQGHQYSFATFVFRRTVHV